MLYHKLYSSNTVTCIAVKLSHAITICQSMQNKASQINIVHTTCIIQLSNDTKIKLHTKQQYKKMTTNDTAVILYHM